MSTTQDAPADTRTAAQRDYDRSREQFRAAAHLSYGETDAFFDMVEAVHAEVAELRRAKATAALVQQLFLAVGEQWRAIEALQATVSGGTAPEPAPTIEALIAEIEAAGWSWKLYGYPDNVGWQAFVRKPHSDSLSGHGWSADSAVAALQEALDRARQAVQL